MNQTARRLSKGQRTAQRILDAAETLISARGYRATTVREIANTAGIQEPGLYNHFKSKEQLFSAMLDRALEPLAAAIGAQLRHSPSLENLPGLISDLLAQHPNIPVLFQQALMSPGDNPGHALVINWLRRLLVNGMNLLPDTGEPDTTRLLHVLAMFNVATGYFTASPLIEALGGKSALDPALLDQQRALADDLAAFLMRREPSPADDNPGAPSR